jgi:hypothetical protein
MMEFLEKYSRLFGKLKRAYQNGGAPHKPILLLAITAVLNVFQG